MAARQVHRDGCHRLRGSVRLDGRGRRLRRRLPRRTPGGLTGSSPAHLPSGAGGPGWYPEPVGAPRFGALVTAMVTPFDESGRLDLDGAVTLARWLVDHGSDGLLLAGTTG
ncbi:MAG: dihydrodipicolinate synthase family protein, partial [Acidimicrobiales bacterium]